jgi:hypothetical protein
MALDFSCFSIPLALLYLALPSALGLIDLVHKPNASATDDPVVILAFETRYFVFVLVEPLEDPNLRVPPPNSILANGALVYPGQGEELRAAVAAVVFVDLNDVVHNTTSGEVIELNEGV